MCRVPCGAMVTAGPPTSTPEPSRTLAPAARVLWRLEGLLSAAVALICAGVLQGVVGGRWALLGWVAALVAGVVSVVLVPELRWRRWRWEVREHEIDIRRGTLAVTRTLVPMLRVQHVDTKRDLLQQALGLATVVFHTAAGANEIPALTVAEAGQVRDRIAELARTADEL
jgi:membrane protein YdbS with pleckstrin-like domain